MNGRRSQYRLVGGGATLVWEGPRIDSRVEQVTCSAAWFYAQMTHRPQRERAS